MFATLRRIRSSYGETKDGSNVSTHASNRRERGGEIGAAVFDSIGYSEHCLLRLHEERRATAAVVAGDQAAKEQMAQFMSRVVRHHMQAIAYEAGVSMAESHDSACKKQQESKMFFGGDTERSAEATTVSASRLLMGNKTDVGQFLWMNRTMALGATCSMLESAHLPPGSLVSRNVRQRETVQSKAPEMETASVHDTVRFLREAHPALRAVLLDVAAYVAETCSEREFGANSQIHTPMSQQPSTPPLTQPGRERLQSSSQGKPTTRPLKRERGGESGVEVIGPPTARRPSSFVVKINEGVMRPSMAPQLSDSLATNGIPGAAANQSKVQLATPVDGYGKLSSTQNVGSQSSLSGSVVKTIPVAQTMESGRLQPTAPHIPLSQMFKSAPRHQQVVSGCLLAEKLDEFNDAEESNRCGGRLGREYQRTAGRVPNHRKRDDGNDEVLAQSIGEGGVGNVNGGGFITASEQLLADVKAKRTTTSNFSMQRRTPALGLRRTGFVPPFQQQPAHSKNDAGGSASNAGGALHVNEVLSSVARNNRVSPDPRGGGRGAGASGRRCEGSDAEVGEYPASLLLPDGSVPPILQPLDPSLVTQIAMEILENGAGAQSVGWDDIAGLEHAKRSVEEAIVWPLRRPDLFVGLRDPPRGLLLFGPPGTGKTMIARAIANRAQCTFLNISASSLMSKWMGDGEKMVRCLFAVATVKQPSVIFIDEIDSLLSMRGEGEMDSVRRVKTEFLVQLDGVSTNQGDRVLLIGATNRPDELDEAARRRMEKRLYIPLPDTPARVELVKRLLYTMEQQYVQQMDKKDVEGKAGIPQAVVHAVDESDISEIAAVTDGFSGADIKQLCREAAMGPLREVTTRLKDVALCDLRPIKRQDFMQALRRIRPSVGTSEVQRYLEWNRQFGTFSLEDESVADTAVGTVD
ncbi:AAA domain [Trypanosoma vivax]|uniref:Putative katanin-like protein n=1 Tax=Trypanosoma vivax (strain Y486) TaxID=1055687 RepID=G0TVF7_TRYVY|nr:putative katanin-like protein [Trypanosoma vivax]KAH8612085.1 AAA domain [Trypanosoma vivax]CCC47923.1 putative katanin-like protein [Trypanosoma vivax Y486]